MKRILALLLALCLLLGLTACGSAPTEETEKTAPAEETPAVSVPVAENVPTATPVMSVRTAADNAEVFAALQAIYGSSGGYRSGVMMTDSAVAEEAEAPAPEPTAAGGVKSYNAAADEYSETNVQVQGVDEGDIVKTDGRYIYVLRDLELLILSAEGTGSRVLYREYVGERFYGDSEDEEGSYTGSEGRYRTPTELYIAGDRLMVIYSESSWRDYKDESGQWFYESGSKTSVDIFDVSDPAAPVPVNTFAQDGDHRSSRLTDGRLVLISDYWVYDADESEPTSYIPRLYKGGAEWNMPADSIWLPENCGSSCFTVVSALDAASGEETAALSLLGGCDTVYMTADKLYLADRVGREETGEPRTEDVYTVRDYSYVQETELVCVSLDSMTVTASATVEGTLLNQFSMDEYNGYLRLVTTTDSYSYTIYEDEERGFVNYDWPEEQESETSGLYVLDSGLNIVGSITGLGEDERVYSVRFDGDTGYFVTFRQTDPLFAVDLSDPTAPKMLSALKIPGFSDYLHVYGEGRLFGLGMSADEETGWTESMKLSMFDTSDPANVTEKYTLILDEYYSEALYNHKAILISPEKDIIAFPAGEGYEIYGYSDTEGFYLRSRIEGDSDMWWKGNARGLYIGNYGYVVLSDQLWVLDLNEMTTLCSLQF